MIEQARGPAIETKFLGPTNTRGARIMATIYLSYGKAKTVFEWDHRMGTEENHLHAARKLCNSLNTPMRGNDATWSYKLYDAISWTDKGYLFIANLTHNHEGISDEQQ